jgi:hypothetical protein
MAQAPQQPMPQQPQQMADGGLAELAIPDDMFNEESYAGGGIVSFANNQDQPVRLGMPGKDVTKTEWDAMSLTQKLAYTGSNKQQLMQSDAIKYPSPAISMDLNNLTGNANAVNNYFGNKETPTAKPPGAQLANSPLNPNADPQAVAEKQKQLLIDRFNLKPVPPKAIPQTDLPPSAANAGIGSLTYKGPTDMSGEYDSMLRTDQSAQSALQKYKDLLGVDPNKAKMQERLQAMDDRTAKSEETAPWMALAKAGFSMASGKSPNAFTNIAEGAGAGLADLAASRDKIATAKDKQFEMASRLSAAERAEQVAAATYGLNSEEATKAHNERVKLSKLGYKTDLATANAKGEFEAQKGNLERDLNVAKLAEDSSWHKLQYNADQARTGVLGANAQFTKEQAQATNLLKQIMAPKMAGLKNKGYTEEDAYAAVFDESLAKLPPNMLAALGYTSDYVKGIDTPTSDLYIKKYGLTPKPQPK